MRPELLSRITATVVFRALNKKDAKQIVGTYIAELQRKLSAKLKLKLKVSQSVIDKIVEDYNPEEGVRNLLNLARSELEDVIVDYISDENPRKGSTVSLSLAKNKIKTSSK